MEGDAGASRLNPTDDDDNHANNDDDGAAQPEVAEESLPEPTDARRPERLGRGWIGAVCAVLLLLAGGLAGGGYLLSKTNERGAQIAGDDAAALRAAKDCVTATQAPDTASMGAAQARIVDCSTGAFGAQAVFYSSMMLEAYQAAKVQVEVADLRAAVERHHDDGSVDVLVAVRTKVTNSETAGQEQGYRLRVKMQRADGVYKIADLVQVTT
jgi:Mce-associated membrane protein